MDVRRLTDIDVLVVEDSPTQALLLKESLAKYVNNVRIARDGIEGLQLISQKIPSLVISDIRMPRMDGYELCRQIKSDSAFAQIPVILLTNLSDSMDVIHGIDCGADSFLTKPYEMSFLLANIEDVLANKKKMGHLKNAMPIEFTFEGNQYTLKVDQVQITNLLLSTYSNAMQKNLELEQAYRNLNAIHQEVEKKNDELSKLNALKNEFLGMAAHDLRNPLGVINGYSKLIMDQQKSKVGEGELKMLDRIQKSSLHMLQIINDLLDISVIESGNLHLRLSKIDIVAFIKEFLSIEAMIAEKKNIKLAYQGEEKAPEVCCDKDKLEQVLSNLFSNAIKFSNPGSTIEVKVTPTEKEVVISITDHGPGIPANELDRLFHPFSKTSVKSTAGEQSTGLGLVIAKKIVDEHGGRIWVESQTGKGTTFYVALPYEAGKK